jgi:diguanylate cyclase (GGDEF)-like protein/PAS domain S-box-containing protein
MDRLPLPETDDDMPFSAQNSKQLKAFVDAIGACVAVFEKSEHGGIVMVAANRHYTAMLERDPEVASGTTISDLFPRYLCLPLIELIDTCMGSRSTLESEIVIDRAGRISWWRFVFSPIFGGDGKVERVLNTCIDITDKKSLESSLAQSQSRFEAVVDAAYDGIISVDQDHKIVLLNNAACAIFQVNKPDMIGKRLETLIPQRFREKHADFVKGFGRSPVNSRPMESRVTVMGLRRDGTEFPAEVTIAKIKVGNDTEYTAVVRDISERAKLIDELQRAAIKDPLTGVYNRRQLTKILQDEVERCRRFGHSVTIAMIDLNGFKIINDTHGHHVGDEVLVAFTQAIKPHLRPVDTLGRWGGDEFLIIWPETQEATGAKAIESIRKDLADVAERLSTPDVTISFGVGIVESDGSIDPDEIMLRADKLLYRDKRDLNAAVS